MISASPPTARLLPRSPGEHLHAGQRAVAAWCRRITVQLVHAVLLVAPVVVLAGAVIALAIAFTAHSQRLSYPVLTAPPPQPGGLCGHDDPAVRDACWNALFDRMTQGPSGSVAGRGPQPR